MKNTYKHILAGIFVIIFLLALVSCGSSPKIYNNNTMHTVTNFSFTDDGKAYVSVDYTGYRDTTGAVITITIEKQGLFFFRKEIVKETYIAIGNAYQNEFFYPVQEDGTYICTVVYQISGIGEDDIITFKDRKDYRATEYPAQTSDITSTESVSAEITSTETTSAKTTTTVTTETTSAEETTTEESTSALPKPEIPLPSPSEFADMLASEISEKKTGATRFTIDKNVEINGKSYDTHIKYMSIEYDLRDSSAPIYHYFITAYSKTEQYENFYDYLDGTLYISINGDRLQKPLSAEMMLAHIPPHPLAILFEKRNYSEFKDAVLSRAENGGITASVVLPFAVYYEEMISLIDYLTNDDIQTYPPMNYWDLIEVSVTLDETGALSGYTLSFSYETSQWDLAIPTSYFISATEKMPYKEDFRDYGPKQKDLETYPTEGELPSVPQESICPEEVIPPQETEQTTPSVTPPQESLSAEKEEFLDLFQTAYAKWNSKRYAVNVSSSRHLYIGGLLSVDTPLKQRIVMDCTDPNEPIYYQQAISSESAYYTQTDIYFKNDRLYVSDYAKITLTQQKEEDKYSVIMLSDYFLEDYQRDWIFFEEDMLNDTEFVKNEDGSVTASMKVSAHASKLYALVEATYGDDFSDEYINAFFFYPYNVKMTIDANGYITNITVSAQMNVTDMRNGSKYSINYGFIIEPDYTEFNIEFPADLDNYKDITEEYYKK